MRTTLTLDEDVVVQITRLQHIRQASLKRIVNDALRRGLQHTTAREWLDIKLNGAEPLGLPW